MFFQIQGIMLVRGIQWKIMQELQLPFLLPFPNYPMAI